MSFHSQAIEEYNQALKLGQKEYKTRVAQGLDPYPAVLDTILDGKEAPSIQEVGTVEVPIDKIVGIKSAGRVSAFTASFLPLLKQESEFGIKWVDLCASHLESGIRDPIICYEYLGDFYVQEGNKRVSVLRCMGAVTVPGIVRRVMPPMSDDPRIKAYYEFLDFYRDSRIYAIQFRKPGCYTELLSYLGKTPGEEWDQKDTNLFRSYYRYFQEALNGIDPGGRRLMPEEALLAWLRVYPFRDLGELSPKDLRRSIEALRDELAIVTLPEPVEVRTEPSEHSPGVLTRLISLLPDVLNIAFVHPAAPDVSTWVKGHDLGRAHIEKVFGSAIRVRSYFDAATPEQAAATLEQAVSDGAQLVFTTTPQLSRQTLKAAIKYPDVKFLNCSVDTPYPSIRTYYSRIYEGKFITGAIAGAMADNDRIGYIGSSPIMGVIASINAFALGAQMTNPRAKVELRWSCVAGNPQADFFSSGIRVVSNRDVPTGEKMYLDFCNYGTYALDDSGKLQPLASPVWLWGNFYEKLVRSVLSGTWDKEKDTPKALNYWWGMSSDVIDVEFSANLPEGIRAMAQQLRAGIRSGVLDPFCRRIVAQDGTVKNDGAIGFTPEELLHMDWLCDNVEGSIPGFDEIEPFARSIVRQLGVYREKLPVEKEENAL